MYRRPHSDIYECIARHTKCPALRALACVSTDTYKGCRKVIHEQTMGPTIDLRMIRDKHTLGDQWYSRHVEQGYVNHFSNDVVQDIVQLTRIDPKFDMHMELLMDYHLMTVWSGLAPLDMPRIRRMYLISMHAFCNSLDWPMPKQRLFGLMTVQVGL